MKGNRNYIYIIFSNTPYKMGNFIRAVTHGAYNHVSVALDGDLSEMYSFARLKRDTPFCGGFVHEGAERYRLGDRIADISVCGINVSEEGAEKVRERINSMKKHPDTYIYNMFSAMLLPLRKKANVHNSFTCVEFATSVLKTAGVRILDECFSATELYTQLNNYEMYRGKFHDNTSIVDNTYYDHVSIPQQIVSSVKQFGRLFHRLV